MIVVTPATEVTGDSTHRPTIADVARAAGVSIALVSYALNGRPGVAPATRERVLRVADEYGWRPSTSARSVRSGLRAIGLAVGREASGVARSASFLDLVTEAGDVLATRDLTLTLQVRAGGDAKAEAEAYRRWWAERRFDVVVVPDVLVDDPRVAMLHRIGAPAVVLAPADAASGLGSAAFDEGDAYARIGAYLGELRHRRVAVVTGPGTLHRTHVRLEALTAALAPFGGVAEHCPTDATGEEAATATASLLTSSAPPTAIVYDTDLMAVAGLDVARRFGCLVPWDVSVVSGSDSALCRLATPAITSLTSSMADLGAAVGRAVLGVLDGHVPAEVVPADGIAVRGSTGPVTG